MRVKTSVFCFCDAMPLCPPPCRSDEKLELQWTLEGHQLGVVSVDISHNGAIAASSSLDAHIRLWDLESGKQIKSMDAGPGRCLLPTDVHCDDQSSCTTARETVLPGVGKLRLVKLFNMAL